MRRQKEQLRALARRRMCPIYHVFAERSQDAECPAKEILLRDAQLGRFTVVIVLRCDRFAGTVQELARILAAFQRRHFHFISVRDGLDTTKRTGSTVRRIIALMGRMEFKLKNERPAPGPAKAKKGGTKSAKPVGRPRVAVPVERIKVLKQQGLGWRRIGHELHISHSAARRIYLQAQE